MEINVPALEKGEKVFFNLSRNEKRALCEFQSDVNTIVVPADKNLGLCLINKQDYINRIFMELEKSTDSFLICPLAEATLNETRITNFNEIQQSTLQYIQKEIGGTNIMNYIMEPFRNELKICQLQGLPKLHKPGKKMRLVFNLAGHPCQNLQKFLAKSIDHIVLKFPTLLTNVLELLHDLKDREFNGEETLTIADISNFFPNVDLKYAIDTALQFIKEDSTMHIFGKRYPSESGKAFQVQHWRQLFELAFKNIEFMFNEIIYLQVKGVPIGSSCGPQLANLALHNHIKPKIGKLARLLGTVCFKIYFDDLFAIFECTDQFMIRQLINNLLERSPNRFDEDSFIFMQIKDLVHKPIAYLDIELYAVKQENNKYKLLHRVYTKPCGVYQYVPWRSAHPPATKRGIIKGECIRRMRLCSTLQDWTTTKIDLKKKLINRGYPESVINNIQSSFKFEDANQLRMVTTMKILDRRRNSVFPWAGFPQPTTTVMKIPFVIKYDPRHLRNLKNIKMALQEKENEIMAENEMKELQVILAFKTGKRLGNVLKIKSKGSENSSI